MLVHGCERLLGYVPSLLKVIVAIALGVLMLRGLSRGRFAQASSKYAMSRCRASRALRSKDCSRWSSSDVCETGVWRADLDELSQHLERLPWVRTAVVSRVLPDGIRVRITEREPRAVVRTVAGRFIWVDDDAVLLGEMLPTDQMPAFFLRGWNEDDGDSARKENQ